MNWLLKYTLIITLVLTGLGILGVFILGELPDSVIIVNPYLGNFIAFCAYSAVALCGAGFFSIFIKVLRMPVGVATCVLLMLLLNFITQHKTHHVVFVVVEVLPCIAELVASFRIVEDRRIDFL